MPPRPGRARCGPGYCAAPPRFCLVSRAPLTIFRRREVPRGSAAVRGARQAVLLPPLRADLRAAARLRDGGDPHLRRPEVRVPELLLPPDDRSEEHTSELQSRSDLVCRLLLEKKKTNLTG